jgi:hypothetical protein
MPLYALALTAGLFAAFGLVEDLAHGRGPYAWVRTRSAAAHAVLRAVGPALGAAVAVALAGLVAVGWAIVRFPNAALRDTWPGASPVDPVPWLFTHAPALSDLAWIGFACLITASLTLLAATAARMRRQLVTVLTPIALVIVAPPVLPSPLRLLNPSDQSSPSDHFGLALSLLYWLAIGGGALALVVARARTGTERTE